jgi:hypothetical protein
VTNAPRPRPGAWPASSFPAAKRRIFPARPAVCSNASQTAPPDPPKGRGQNPLPRAHRRGGQLQPSQDQRTARSECRSATALESPPRRSSRPACSAPLRSLAVAICNKPPNSHNRIPTVFRNSSACLGSPPDPPVPVQNTAGSVLRPFRRNSPCPILSVAFYAEMVGNHEPRASSHPQPSIC